MDYTIEYTRSPDGVKHEDIVGSRKVLHNTYLKQRHLKVLKKKTVSIFLCICLVMMGSILFSTIPVAYGKADGMDTKANITDLETSDELEKPGPWDLTSIGSQIEYPKGNDYLGEYQYATVKAPHGHSVYGYGSADRLGSCYTVLDGETVKIIAERNGYSCCVVLSLKRARWINSKYLVPAESAPEENWVLLSSRCIYENGTGTEAECYLEKDDIWVKHYFRDKDEARWEIRIPRRDIRGNQTGMEIFDLVTGKLISQSIYEYDVEGRMSRSRTFNDEGNLISEELYKQENGQNTAEYHSFDENGEIAFTFIHIQDMDGNDLRSEIYGNDGELSSLTETEYDEEGHKIRGHYVYYVTSQYFDDFEKEIMYEYNSDGLLTKEINTAISGLGTGNQSVVTHTYDINGNELEYRVNYDDNIGTSSIYIYSWGLIGEGGDIIQISGEPWHITLPETVAEPFATMLSCLYE